MSEAVDYLKRQAATALGRPLLTTETSRLDNYLNLLTKWRQSQRLIGSSDPRWIVDNVIADSLLFSRVLPAGVATLCDVGSGAGIPGVPLAIVLSRVHVTLLEPSQKRGSFLAAAIRELPLPNCRLVNQRLEEARPQLARRFDAVVMRCAGNPASIFPDVLPVLAKGGIVIASGPPEPYELLIGRWVEVEGPKGPRRFWIHREA